MPALIESPGIKEPDNDIPEYFYTLKWEPKSTGFLIINETLIFIRQTMLFLTHSSPPCKMNLDTPGSHGTACNPMIITITFQLKAKSHIFPAMVRWDYYAWVLHSGAIN